MKRSFWAFALILVLAAIPTVAKDKPILPEKISKARFVLVQSFDGNEFSPEVLQEDRQAILDVQSAIQKWGHYRLAYRLEDAEIILVVRRGRWANVRAGTTTEDQSARWRRGTTDARAEVGTPDDTLAVYDARPDALAGAPLWLKTQSDGLKPPGLPLFTKLQEEVEKAAEQP
jgi:hypothetical protein